MGDVASHNAIRGKVSIAINVIHKLGAVVLNVASRVESYDIHEGNLGLLGPLNIVDALDENAAKVRVTAVLRKDLIVSPPVCLGIVSTGGALIDIIHKSIVALETNKPYNSPAG